MRTERKFNYVFWMEISLIIIFKSAVRCFSQCLVIAAVVLIASVAAAGFLVILPVIAQPWSPWFYFNLFWGEIAYNS